jgi:hypothetical protein
LEEVDLLFASNSPFTWDEERTFKQLKQQMEEGRKITEVVQGPEVSNIEKV